MLQDEAGDLPADGVLIRWQSRCRPPKFAVNATSAEKWPEVAETILA